MKTIKVILAVSFLLVNTMIFAQGGGQRGGQQGPPPIPNDEQIEKMVNDLSDELSLTEKQEASILELYKDHFKKVKEKRSNNERPPREEMEQLRSDLQKDVKTELTEAQISKYEAFLKKQKDRPRKRR